jgi:ligand-binding sensor protein
LDKQPTEELGQEIHNRSQKWCQKIRKCSKTSNNCHKRHHDGQLPMAKAGKAGARKEIK